MASGAQQWASLFFLSPFIYQASPAKISCGQAFIIMLQKVENLYLAILRFVVLLVAGLLLVAVVGLGVSSFSLWKSAPAEQPVVPTVTDSLLKKKLLAQDDAATPEQAASAAAAAAQKADPNKVYFERAATAIVAFVKAHSEDSDGPSHATVVEVTRDHAAKYETEAQIGNFGKGFAESLERLLKDPAVIAQAKKTSALDLVNLLLDSYTEEFDAQLEKGNAANAAKQVAHEEQRDEGKRNLYVAGGAFGAFLMLVFLSISIRIERNLRHLERLAK